MTEQERQEKLALVSRAARRVNQHLSYSAEVQANMTQSVREARAASGVKPLACDAPQPTQKSVPSTSTKPAPAKSVSAAPADRGKALLTAALGIVRRLQSMNEHIGALEQRARS